MTIRPDKRGAAESSKPAPKPAAGLRLGRLRIPLPRSRPARRALGAGLIAGGSLFFLPVFGLWMLPAGLAVLSVDSARVRRLRRKAELWWGRRSSKPN